MISVIEAIQQRRSIRKFKEDVVPIDLIHNLIEAASLAPSSCNSQPWRFKIVYDQTQKDSLIKATFNQHFISKASAIIVCCADISKYKEDSFAGIAALKEADYIDDSLYTTLNNRLESFQVNESIFEIIFNVAIAIENIMLRAVELNLGCCWVGLINEQMVKKFLGLSENLVVVSLVAVGFPAESPDPRRRLPINDLILK